MLLQVKNKDFVVAEHQELMQNSIHAFVRTLFPAEVQEPNGVDKVSLLSLPAHAACSSASQLLLRVISC